MSANYRPVSLTCVCCKMMESLIKDDLTQHLQRNKLISPSQHGFMKNKSCTTNLLEFLEELTAEADSGKHVDIVYLDFAKAFDKVPTAKLMKKLKVHGVEGRAAAWIQAWLTGRTQRVTIKGKTSGWRRVWSGVPQGSVLGPVLFLIFINDLDSAATEKQTIKKFADDTKVMQVIETAEDAAELQRCLDRLCDWARTWGMAFNESKCHMMHVGLRNPGHVYYMNGVRLEASEKERDVGVTISSSLKLAQPAVPEGGPNSISCTVTDHKSVPLQGQTRFPQPLPAVCAATFGICRSCLGPLDPSGHPVPGVSPTEGRQSYFRSQGNHI